LAPECSAVDVSVQPSPPGRGHRLSGLDRSELLLGEVLVHRETMLVVLFDLGAQTLGVFRRDLFEQGVPFSLARNSWMLPSGALESRVNGFLPSSVNKGL
jgi:hypothetical protein